MRELTHGVGELLEADEGGDLVSATHLGEPLQVELAARATLLVESLLFCRKIKGIRRLQASSIKWAPLSALSEKSTPLFARRATG